MRGILAGRLGGTWGHHATPGRAKRSRLRLAGTSGGKTLRSLPPPKSSEHAEVTFTNLKGPFYFSSFPFRCPKRLAQQLFWMGLVWINILAEVFSLLPVLWKYPPCGEQSPAVFEVEFPAVLMCSLNSLMEYFKGKLRHLLIS